MAEITTDKPINRYQVGLELAARVGGSPPLRIYGPDAQGRHRLRSDVPQADLDAVVAAHVADPAVQPIPTPPEPTETERLDTIEPLVLPPHEGTPERDRFEAIRDGAENALDGLRQIRDSTGNLSAANLSAAVRLLARVCIVLIRLALRRLDAAD